MLAYMVSQQMILPVLVSRWYFYSYSLFIEATVLGVIPLEFKNQC